MWSLCVRPAPERLPSVCRPQRGPGPLAEVALCRGSVSKSTVNGLSDADTRRSTPLAGATSVRSSTPPAPPPPDQSSIRRRRRSQRSGAMTWGTMWGTVSPRCKHKMLKIKELSQVNGGEGGGHRYLARRVRGAGYSGLDAGAARADLNRCWRGPRRGGIRLPGPGASG